MKISRHCIYNWLARNKYHFYFWPPMIIFFILLDYLQFPEYTFWQRELYMAFVQLCIFYSTLFVLVRFKRRTIENWIASICRLLLSFGFIMFLNHWRGKIAALFGYNIHETFHLLFLDTIRIYWGLAFYAIGYYYITRSNRKEKELRYLAEAKAATDLANAEMKQNLLQLENDFLRAQINPHFLYNTLNVFYAKAMGTNPELAEGLVSLAEVMRYSLEATDNNQLAPLQTEVGHLERVIAIHRLRFGDDMKIEFIAEGPYGLVSIAPLILITLLENALKHGDVESGASPIRLWLCVDAERIYFTIQNNKTARPTGNGSLGIGLTNVRRRLTNVYGTGYTLEVFEEPDTYHVALVIAHNTIVNPGAVDTPTTTQAINEKIGLPHN